MSDATVLDNSLGRHVVRTLILAWPVMLSRLGLVGLLTVDVLVLGRAGAEELAHYILGQSISDSLLAAVAGLVMGVAVLTSRELGAGRPEAGGTIWRRGCWLGALAALACALPLQFAGPAFAAAGIAPDIAAEGGRVTAILALAMPAVAVYFASTIFLEALERPLIGTVAVIGANILNVSLDLLLVFGFGWGAVGAAIASLGTFSATALALVVYIRLIMPDRARFGIGRRVPAGSPLELLRIGAATGATYLLEASAFGAMTILIGRLGQTALAAHGVLFQVLGLSFMVAFGIAQATQVRVGNAWGRMDPVGVTRAGLVGFGLAVAACTLIALGCLGAQGQVVAVFTPDPIVMAAALPVLIWTLAALIGDGAQTALTHACRGRGDTWALTAVHLFSYWLVMVPLATVLDGRAGLAGIFQAIAAASAVSTLAVGLRFYVLSKRTLPPPQRD